MKWNLFFATVVISLSLTEVGNAQSTYTLWNPTPREQMRELSADRPDATESPVTVDAGHFQVELSLIDWGKDDEAGRDIERWTLFSTNIKVGLVDNIDLQLVFDAYSEEEVRERGVTDRQTGFSDVQIRLKWNLWGNDGEDTALALFPYIKIPTGTEFSNDEIEGGLMIPYSVTLTDQLSLGLMGEIDVVYDAEEEEHSLEFLHTAVLGWSMTEDWGSYLEYIGIVTEDDYLPHLSGGMTYALSEDVVLDAGAVVGLKDEAEDFSFFIGMTVRY